MDMDSGNGYDAGWAWAWYRAGFRHAYHEVERRIRGGDPHDGRNVDADALMADFLRLQSDSPGPFALELVEEGVRDAVARRRPRY